MIGLKHILERYDLGAKMAQILDELGMDTIKHGVSISVVEHMDPVIVDEATLKEHLWSINKAEITNHSVKRSEGAIPPSITLHMTLWGHAGIPDGDNGKFLGTIAIEIEEMAFVLLMAKYL